MISQTEKNETIERLVVLLIRVTKYGWRGYPLRFWRGVVPSNSLATMYSLTKWALQRAPLNRLQSEVRAFDDFVWRQRVDNPVKLMRRYGGKNTKVVIGLVGVQTNQFPRAVDLARQFKSLGAEVVIGGFHVSGSISAMYDGIAATDPSRKDVPCPRVMPPEIEQLMNEGIIVCHGEAEGIWRTILCDIVRGTAEKLYRGGKPALSGVPLPRYPEGYFNDFAVNIVTVDTGRGCPFKCSFCTIINVQGREPRWRDPKDIVVLVKRMGESQGQFSGFFTDDNFARNPHWEAILDDLIELRREGRRISFTIQADLAVSKLKNFVQKLARAGCTSIFLGMESVRPEALKKVHKPQNLPQNYQPLCDLLHQHGIHVHAGYIIGFPDDTAETIREDIETVKRLGIDQLSPFILTPLPGSEDHVRMYLAGVAMDSDFNRYDSFEPVTDHPNMTREEWHQAFFRVFRDFYQSAHMIESLKRAPKEARKGLFQNYLWYRNSALGEKVHPMNCGFISRRQRQERRPGLPQEDLLTFWAQEARHYLKYFFGHIPREFYVFQHVYYQVELRPPIAAWLNNFWREYGRQRWNLLKPWHWHWHLRILPYCVTEVMFTLHFLYVLKKTFGTIRYTRLTHGMGML